MKKKTTSSESYKIIRKDAGYRFDKNGWVYVHVEGAPFEIGKQFAFLVALEYKRAIETINYSCYETLGINYAFFVENAARLHKGKFRTRF